MNKKKIYISLILAISLIIIGFFIFSTDSETKNTSTTDIPSEEVTAIETIEVEEEKKDDAHETQPSKAPAKQKVNKNEIISDIIPIEDYGDSTSIGRGMVPFYNALGKREELGRPIRIAVFGDSFIEADILTGDFREMLQSEFGGCGVGFVSITSKTNSYRPTIHHNFNGWNSYAYTDKDKKNHDRQKIGISGYYFETQGGASVKLSGVNKYAALLDTCERVTFFLKNQTPIELGVKVNNGERSAIHINRSNHLQAKSIDGRIATVDFEVQKADSMATFYGIAMDGKDGVTVDNYSMRGSSGLFLCTVPITFLEEFNNIRPYDLIILQYGLNVLSNKTTNYRGYEQKMISAVERLKASFPQSGILIMSIGDRAYKNPQTQKMESSLPHINALLECQRNIARTTGVAFWNVFEAMGGDGGMVKMVNSKPALANKDYTHINFNGGRFIAGQLFNALVDGIPSE